MSSRVLRLLACFPLLGAFSVLAQPGPAAGPAPAPVDPAAYERGRQGYASLCASCHAADGKGVPRLDLPGGVTLAPSLADNARVNGHRDYLIYVLLHGLTGPIDGREYQESMPPVSANSDAWIADVATYVRQSFGNRAAPIAPADVARIRAAVPRRGFWTVAELEKQLAAEPAK